MVLGRKTRDLCFDFFKQEAHSLPFLKPDLTANYVLLGCSSNAKGLLNGIEALERMRVSDFIKFSIWILIQVHFYARSRMIHSIIIPIQNPCGNSTARIHSLKFRVLRLKF